MNPHGSTSGSYRPSYEAGGGIEFASRDTRKMAPGLHRAAITRQRLKDRASQLWKTSGPTRPEDVAAFEYRVLPKTLSPVRRPAIAGCRCGRPLFPGISRDAGAAGSGLAS